MNQAGSNPTALGPNRLRAIRGSVSASFSGPALIAAAGAFHFTIGILEACTAGILLNLSGIGTAERARRFGLNWGQQHGTRD